MVENIVHSANNMELVQLRIKELEIKQQMLSEEPMHKNVFESWEMNLQYYENKHLIYKMIWTVYLRISIRIK